MLISRYFILLRLFTVNFCKDSKAENMVIVKQIQENFQKCWSQIRELRIICIVEYLNERGWQKFSELPWNKNQYWKRVLEASKTPSIQAILDISKLNSMQ